MVDVIGTAVMLVLGLAAVALLVVVFVQLIVGEVREARGRRR